MICITEQELEIEDSSQSGTEGSVFADDDDVEKNREVGRRPIADAPYKVTERYLVQHEAGLDEVGHQVQSDFSEPSIEDSGSQIEAEEEGLKGFDRDAMDETLHSVDPEEGADAEDNEYHSAPEKGETDTDLDIWAQMQVQKELEKALDVDETRVKKRVLEYEMSAVLPKKARTMRRTEMAVKHRAS